MAVQTAPVHVFGVRHLSAAAAFHLDRYLEKIQPEAVLIEGPSDATDWLRYFAALGTRPPLAILAYTNDLPAQSILYPFAAYSPEFVGAFWALKKKVSVEFIDLPCSVFLGMKCRQLEELQHTFDNGNTKNEAEIPQSLSGLRASQDSLYTRWAKISGYDNYDTYWEAEFEHNLNEDSYRDAAMEFGKSMRALEEVPEENLIRESYMRRQIQKVIQSGIVPEKIVVVCGAYHAPVIAVSDEGMTDAAYKNLPNKACSITLMPYSNLRLSSRTGYGAGNESPRYFQMMYTAMTQGKLAGLPNAFFTEVARTLRKEGTFKSTAEVIEAVRLSQGLAALRGQSQPTLSDLRAAAVTCLANGESSVIAKAMAAVEVGIDMGSLPEGVSRTAIQDDFYKSLKELKLDKYCSPVAETLELDLRENRTVKSEKSRWLDLARSYFLHRLRMLGNPFAEPAASGQTSATWKEIWNLQWTTEAEIQLAESSLMGETIELAAAYKMKEILDNAASVSVISEIIDSSSKCGMSSMLSFATQVLQNFTIDSGSFAEGATAITHLVSTVTYGDIRRMETKELLPLIARLFLRGTLIIIDNAHINQSAVHEMFDHMNHFNRVASDLPETVDVQAWLEVLHEMAARDDINASLSGYACALLLERGLMSGDELEQAVIRRLSPGISADIGAGWFEGLASRNHYGLISRVSVWEMLDSYLVSLDEEVFPTALVYLRRTFSSFSPEEKRSVFAVLSGFWEQGPDIVETKLTAELNEEEQSVIDSLNDFNFDDL